ncbi:MAG: polyprenyl synthetase family protein [Methanospirillaceae archaeon]|nr:polyprenyl synthetase family protein [Methanospirillaceae archaeon]
MDLTTYLQVTAEEVTQLLHSYYGSPDTTLSEAANHLLFSGGKRLRPVLFKLAAEAVSPGSSRGIMPAGLALEVTHCFTLIHDDIMDKDQFRRGNPTVHTKWDEPTGILAGDVLYARAFELISHTEAPDSAKVNAVLMLSQACVEICEGQQEDMSFEKRNDVSRDEYLSMVQKKTGVLYGAAAGIGVLCAGGSAAEVAALSTYGNSIGAAFQIQDDIIDLMIPSDKSGKDQASDIREGKQTLLAIYARERGLDLSSYRRSLKPSEIQDLIALLSKHNVIADVQQEAEDLISTGIDSLSILTDSHEKELLIELAHYFIRRSS